MASPHIQVRSLELSVDQLKGVGPKLAQILAGAGMYQLVDVLFRLPIRYLDRTRISPMGSLQPDAHVVIQGEIQAADVLSDRRRSLMIKIADGTGIATLRFFHFSNSQKNSMRRGKHLRCYGQVRMGRAGLELYHPEYEFVAKDEPLPDTGLTPVYPLTEGLTQKRMRDLARQSLQVLEQSDVEELLPEETIGGRQVSLKQALLYLHQPPPDAPLQDLLTGCHPLQRKIAFEELVAHQVSLQRARIVVRAQQALSLRASEESLERFHQQLGFRPTRAQRRVLEEINDDLQSDKPMLRLLQGDVGSGKTLVAAETLMAALDSGHQAALMAPTEILAEQHLNTLSNWFADSDYSILFLSGKTRGKARDTCLEMIASGQALLVIGTHALIQPDVVFADLGLLVIDEQHRFGVGQRMSLGEKGLNADYFPHQLVMTATPIPRTLAMSRYSDLDTSIIDEMPPGRSPVTTAALPSVRRTQVIERVREAVREGRQAYWVCTLVEESEVLQAQAAEATAAELKTSLAGLNIGLVHGRVKSAEKTAVMDSFKAGNLDVLVATTVIEVGVDVPNASLMIIENPERLGLSQLHQLRGRVGRGSDQSHCLLLYEAPLSKNSAVRIKTMRETNDGFKIADTDLELRGPGELLGHRQAGEVGFLMADIVRDAELLPRAVEVARQMLATEPERAERLFHRWLPQASRYLNA